MGAEFCLPTRRVGKARLCSSTTEMNFSQHTRLTKNFGENNQSPQFFPLGSPTQGVFSPLLSLYKPPELGFRVIAL